MGTYVTVNELPPCDTHSTVFPDEATVPARVDGKTVYGPWANMCTDCHNRIGLGLGTGHGQRLLLPTENR